MLERTISALHLCTYHPLKIPVTFEFCSTSTCRNCCHQRCHQIFLTPSHHTHGANHLAIPRCTGGQTTARTSRWSQLLSAVPYIPAFPTLRNADNGPASSRQSSGFTKESVEIMPRRTRLAGRRALRVHRSVDCPKRRLDPLLQQRARPKTAMVSFILCRSGWKGRLLHPA